LTEGSALVRTDRTQAASILLIHGAGSGPWVFDGWQEAFSGLVVAAVDLQDGLDPARASMQDYAQNVISAARALPEPVTLCGWSMGGLVALQAVAALQPDRLILLEASAPAEVQGFDPSIELAEGTFDPEAEYGRFPPGVRARPESHCPHRAQAGNLGSIAYVPIARRLRTRLPRGTRPRTRRPVRVA
jgi:pimeloyl-ACP methyl ester carboxylesterase